MVPQESNKDYLTVKNIAVYEMTEKKSRFTSWVFPIDTVSAANTCIQEVSSAHRDASHNTYAYIVRENNAVYQKYSDDGEPQGKGGLPILEVLINKELFNVVVVVTRYFGGVLLGTGGLIRAYGKCAQLGIDKSGIVKKVFCKVFDLKIDYQLSGKVIAFCEGKGYKILDKQYSDNVIISVAVPEREADRFNNKVTDITSNKLNIALKEEKYIETEG